MNRAIHEFTHRFPRASTIVARLIPLHVPAAIRRLIQSDRPILIAGFHIGPVFFAIAVVLKALRGRPVYVLHSRNTHFTRVNSRYLQRLGVRSVVNDDASLRVLAHALRTERRCAVIMAVDHVAEGRRLAKLFDARIAISHGIAYLADVTDATVIAACWKSCGSWPRVDIVGPFDIERTFGTFERRARLMRALLGLLETLIIEAPEQWTEWPHVFASTERAAKFR